MTAWQYAQLVITRDGRGNEDNQTILWHGPGQGVGENLSRSGQTVLELLNRAGADGWELADREVRQVHGEGDHYRDAKSSHLMRRLGGHTAQEGKTARSATHAPSRPVASPDTLLVLNSDVTPRPSAT